MYKVIDMSERKCNNDHKWELTGFYKHNPHLWCSYCFIYLDQNEIKAKGYTDIFHDLLNNNNPEGYYNESIN